MSLIEVRNVTKNYRLGQLTSIKQSLLNTLQRARGRHIERRKEFSALSDVNFSVDEGEVLGIIGHNGAGKSTLLKLLARVSTATNGSIRVGGKVAPLIEVGAGLVADLTGRENIYLNATILGMRRAEIRRRFDEIVAFAELEEFIDTPIKRYSSGMQVRLGFSIATSVDAEILIVDEVLAVGDLAFQRKCFNRMESLIKHSGKTVLLVSHNIRQVSRICSRVIMLDHGRILEDGSPEDVCDLFYRRSNEKVLSDSSKEKGGRIATSGEAHLLSIAVIGEDGQPAKSVVSGEELRVRVCFKLDKAFEQLEVVVGTHTSDFVYLNTGSTAALSNKPDFEAGVHQVDFIVDSYPLVPGPYNLRLALLDKNRRMIFSGEALAMFVVDSPFNEANEAAARLLDLQSHWIIDGKKLERSY